MTEEDETTYQPAENNSYRKYIPLITVICGLVSIVLFLGINLSKAPADGWATYNSWGYFSVMDIFGGSYWGLITSNFVHLELWHIAFNLYWLWYFGKKIEFESNKLFYLVFILSSAVISSLSELLAANDTGIGLSGIGYALFGFILIKSIHTEAYRNYLDKRLISVFFGWLILCIVLTKAGLMNVANAAHFGGLIWGMLIAYISRFNWYKQLLIGTVAIGLLTSALFWNPYSVSWLTYKAYDLHQHKKIDEAISVYREILYRDSKNEFAKANLELLQIHQLEVKAYDFHQANRFSEAKRTYREILRLDPGNEWARENMELLP